MRPEMGRALSEEQAKEIKNQGERDFALACLKVGCEIYYQIAVGESNIDFFVINPKANNPGKFVEITMEKRGDLEKKFVQKGRGRQKKRVVNVTGMRKQRQIENMKESGRKWTILFDEEVRNLREKNEQI